MNQKFKIKAYGVSKLLSGHPKIRKLKRESAQPSIHGNKVWHSSYLLMDYFKEFAPNKNTRGLEVGCGWGMTSIFLAKICEIKMLATDADESVFQYFKVLSEQNQIEVPVEVCRFEKMTKTYLSNFDLLVGADICFWSEMVKPLELLILRAIKAGVQKVCIADPERESFFELYENLKGKCKVQLIDRVTKKPIAYRGKILIVER